MPIAAEIHNAVSAVCPINGVSIGDFSDRSTWRVDFDNSATSDQRSAAQAAIDAFNLATADLTDYASGARWAKETGGVTLPNGVRIATDAVAQTKIAAAKTAFDNGTLTGTIQFKAENGWIAADAAAVTSVYTAVVQHVQLCYASEKQAIDGIAAGTVNSAADIDAIFA